MAMRLTANCSSPTKSATPCTTFSRIIQEHSGCKNLKDYLNQKRLRHAAQLLREQPNYTIQAIMQDSGFQSKSVFTTLFKQTCGMTPSEYRNAAV